MAWKPSANDVTKWRDELESVSGRIGLRFVRPEVRQRAQGASPCCDQQSGSRTGAC